MAPFKNLITLGLSSTGVTGEGPKDLAALTNLTTLNLSGTEVPDADAKELRAALPKCKVVMRRVR